MQDICRVCQEFKEKKQKYRLFACNIDQALSNILEQAACKGDGIPGSHLFRLPLQGREIPAPREGNAEHVTVCKLARGTACTHSICSTF